MGIHLDYKDGDPIDLEFLEQYADKTPNWGFNGLGYVVYKRTYARYIEEQGRKEEWLETVARCVNGANRLGAKYTKDEARRLFDYVFNLKCSFSGRGLWQLGTKTLDLIGVDSLLNCWVTKVSCIDDFVFIFMESMLGGGVGCVLTKEYTQELPRVKEGVHVELKNTKDADYIVPDSKEGWAELWRKVLEAYLITGKSFTYSTICVRSSGEPIKTFGGTAPGPKPLIDGVKEITKILEARAGKKLRTPDVADIVCCGGQVVKSGGVRRTALILLGDVDDMSYLQLKRWDLHVIPSYRSNSNNSLLCSKFEHLPEKFWDGYIVDLATGAAKGEPYGLVNMRNSKRFGRLGETEFDGFKLTDKSQVGVNPCAEATLADKESCNLAELFLNNITSKEEMLDMAKLLYKTQKAIAAGEYLFPETNKIVHQNMRLGLGVTGICQRREEAKEWCDYVYRNLRAFDKEYSKENGWNQSIRLTVVKPSGTLSLLSGSTPGVHPGYSTYHIRRIRFASNDPIIPHLLRAGYSVEPEIQFNGNLNHDISVVEFPAAFAESDIMANSFTAVDQLELHKEIQTYWADQAVSVTVYYRPEEVNAIREWLEKNYDTSIKTVSFLLHNEHGFKQAPLQEVDKKTYESMAKRIKTLGNIDDHTKEDEFKILSDNECGSGMCPVK